ncbi:MAG TPA: cytochrome ubiquinol oxidase subunit I [Candidatus Limnocylindrales bacterium]|nr:cytochrome ubiquinol oxidase subunit I [Candidatus Limnocylindrales bacterium]
MLLALDPLPPANLLAARDQMAVTLGFHIILACLGVAFPTILLIANWRAIRHDDADALRLARRWTRIIAVTFAVGAVSGTILSFEMGLLWPGLMGRFGAAYGIPFAIEGIFFFLEAIFIAIYIYGWDRLSPWLHFLSGIPIAVAGFGGTFSVVTANAWMNQPAGFTLGADGQVTDVQPLGVIFNNATWYEAGHMFLAAYMVTGFLLASTYAVGRLRGRMDRYTRLGFLIPFTVAAIATPLQIGMGDIAARAVFTDQPAKFAAMELVQTTGPNQPVVLGGILVNGEVVGGLKIPGLDSLLAGFNTNTVIQGLDSVPIADQPPVDIVHLAWDTMLSAGFALLALAAWFGLTWLRRRELPTSRWFYRFAAAAGVVAVVALEAGWIVTEVGRQPWVVYGLLRTTDAVTRAPGTLVSFVVVLFVYVGLGTATLLVLRAMSRQGGDETARGDDPYGPSQ